MIKTCSIKTLTHEISDCWIEPEFDWNFPRHTRQVTLTDEKKNPTIWRNPLVKKKVIIAAQ